MKRPFDLLAIGEINHLHIPSPNEVNPGLGPFNVFNPVVKQDFVPIQLRPVHQRRTFSTSGLMVNDDDITIFQLQDQVDDGSNI